MAFFRRRRRLPDRLRPPLERDERVVAWAGTAIAGKGKVPTGDAPAGDVPAGDVPADDVLGGDVLGGDVPGADAPSGDVPAGDASAGDVPAGDVPSGDVPAGGVRAGRGPAGAGTGGGVLVATNRGLWLPVDPPARLGWHEINKATWTGDKLVVTAARVADGGSGYDVVEDLPTVAFPLADPGDLPAEVRARVTRSVGPTTHHPLPGGGGARVVARRVPGVDGLRWTVRYDPGVDHDDPVVRELTEQLVAQARAGAGVEP
jgi:hypothetical protein